MPVTNSHSDEELFWKKPGATGMKIKPTGRPSGVLAELAGRAENVGGLTEEERQARGGPEKLLQFSEVAPHQAEIDESHYANDVSGAGLAFKTLDRAAGLAAGGGRLLKRAIGRSK
jgi:hypothetical protein